MDQSTSQRATNKFHLRGTAHSLPRVIAAVVAVLASAAKVIAASPTDVFYGTGAGANITTGFYDTAIGYYALYDCTTGSQNTATGYRALSNNTGYFNTASGSNALVLNDTGTANTAVGSDALYVNKSGTTNTAIGRSALYTNDTGDFNTATGAYALFYNRTGSSNTADGRDALANNTGSSNIAIGRSAGINLTTGNNNIDIGNAGLDGESDTVRIGTKGTHKSTFIAGISGSTVPNGVSVIVGTGGRLGTVISSARFKDDIKPMNEASETILSLRPVSFHYKPDLDPDRIPQFGLVAEEVAKVNPDLVARDDQGKPYTVRYEAINAMLLNEFLKEHRKGQEQDATIAQLKSTVTQQQNDIKALTADLKEQAAQLQKVSAQIRVGKSLVVSNE